MPSESNVQRYATAGAQLLPPGAAFDLAHEDDTGLHDLLEGLAVEFARIHEAAETLYRNVVNPAQANEYLDDWERMLGLPGKCVTNPSTSIAERAGAVVAALRGRGSHARATYEAVARALGYTEQLEFQHFPPMSCGMTVGNSLYSDEWSHAVRVVVPVGDQTADDQLICTFTDQLRRSHTFIDVVLDGPMGAQRTNTSLYSASNNLGASMVLANVGAFPVSYGGHVSIQCRIHNGAGAAPSDTPAGSWKLYASSNGVDFTEVTDTGSDTTIADQLAKIAPNGNNVVNAYAVLDNVPGTSAKLLYVRSSGGGTNATATVNVTSW